MTDKVALEQVENLFMSNLGDVHRLPGSVRVVNGAMDGHSRYTFTGWQLHYARYVPYSVETFKVQGNLYQRFRLYYKIRSAAQHFHRTAIMRREGWIND